MSSNASDHLKMDRDYLQDVGMHKLLEEFVVSALKVKPKDALRYLHEWAGDKLGLFAARGPPPTKTRIAHDVPTDEEKNVYKSSDEDGEVGREKNPARGRLPKKSSDVLNARRAYVEDDEPNNSCEPEADCGRTTHDEHDRKVKCNENTPNDAYAEDKAMENVKKTEKSVEDIENVIKNVNECKMTEDEAATVIDALGMEAAKYSGMNGEEYQPDHDVNNADDGNITEHGKVGGLTADQAALRIQCAARCSFARRQRRVNEKSAAASELQASLDAVILEKEIMEKLTPEEVDICGLEI
eukprot:Tbor_TRINITY_DN1726_c0_g1::TRINITY_DN1726_c0_g1_i1::g.21295::m.21295